MNIKIDIGYPNLWSKNINLNCNRGDIIHIIGDNGSGKSTLYKTLLGDIKTINGNIPLEFAEKCAIISDMVGLPMELEIKDIFNLIGEEKLNQFSQDNHDLINKAMRFSGKKIKYLSSGQRRFLEIITIMATGKTILILDEAFSALDFKNKELCIDLIKSLKKCIIFNTSHNFEEIVNMRGKIFALSTLNNKLSQYSGDISVEKIREFVLSESI